MKWCFFGSEVDIRRAPWSRTAEKDVGEEGLVGHFREMALVELKTADLIILSWYPKSG